MGAAPVPTPLLAMVFSWMTFVPVLVRASTPMPALARMRLPSSVHVPLLAMVTPSAVASPSPLLSNWQPLTDQPFAPPVSTSPAPCP